MSCDGVEYKEQFFYCILRFLTNYAEKLCKKSKQIVLLRPLALIRKL